jgi:hypothetical protein
LTATVLAGVAQFESEVASERQHARNLTKRLAGESLRTRKLYGESEGEDANAVLEAFRLTGSYGAAAKLLNLKGIKPRDAKKWWGPSVRVIVQRLDTTIVSAGPRRKTGSKFELARLLICPTCSQFLTGGTGSQRHYKCCRAGQMEHPKTSIAETKVLPWVRERLTGYVIPGRMVDNSAKRREIDEKRQRVMDLYEDKLIDRVELARRMAPLTKELQGIDATESAPEKIDWTAEPTVINHQLRKLIDGVLLNADFTPRKLVWHEGIYNVRWQDGTSLSPLDDIAADLGVSVADLRPIDLDEPLSPEAQAISDELTAWARNRE